jgi:hypothetical protein
MPNYERQATIDRFEGTNAVLIFENGDKIVWQIKNLPEGIKEGSILKISISDEKSVEEERRKLAKELINEILVNSE